jgi:S-formylglutathione hydrolase FrmB
MANAVYPKFKQALWLQSANSNASTGAVKVALVDTGVYTYSAAHEFVSSLSGTVGTAQTIGNKTFVNGVLDGDNVTFTGVTGNTIEALVIYIDTGNASTSRLISYQDTSVTGLPATPNGGDITITWNASGILAL